MSGPIRHGGALDAAIARFGGSREEWLDLSTGVNPHAYPIGELPGQVWTQLPDAGAMTACLDAARAYNGVKDGVEILAAAGTQAIIQWLPHVWPDMSAVIVEPAYGEYAHVFSHNGRRVKAVADLADVRGHGQVVFVGNPNNPDGRVRSVGDVERVLALGNVVVIDEAFADVMPEKSLIGLAGHPGVLVLKSFGKFFGLAGVRLGFAVGHAEITAKLGAMLGPWAVPGAGLHVGAKAMSDITWINRTRDTARKEAGELRALLSEHGFGDVGHTDLFVTVSHSDTRAVAQGLARHKILVRTFDYAKTWMRFGLPGDEAAFTRLRTALPSIER